jgi:hypothetical protein
MNHDELMANQTWGETVWDWAETRNYWLLLFALPALLGFVGVGSLPSTSSPGDANGQSPPRPPWPVRRKRRATIGARSLPGRTICG